MTIRSGFFKSVGGDRKYLAEFFTSYFGSFIGNGVFPNPSTNLQVVAGTNMTVNVRPGKGWINGYYLENDSDFSLTHIPANGTFNRIDRIVFAVNFDTRDMTIYIKQGANGATASPPALIRNSTVYELCLADVSIPAGTTTITQSLITDTRQNNELCGIVHGTVDQVDTTTLYNQYQTYLNEFQQSGTQQFQSFLSASQQEFDEFFQALEENLSGDVAGNLQNQITQLQNDNQKATQQEALQGINNTKVMTPLRVKQVVDSKDNISLGSNYDLNTLRTVGKYSGLNFVNAPVGVNSIGFLEVISYSRDWLLQRFHDPLINSSYIRYFYNGTTFSPWKRIYNEIATTAQAQSGTDNTTIMTPQRVAENTVKKVSNRLANLDLNSIIDSGEYSLGAGLTLGGTTLPQIYFYGNLKVLRSSDVVTQTIYAFEGDIFHRSFSTNNNTRPDFYKIADKNIPINSIGELNALQTTNKNSLVSAINEVKQQANDIKTRWANVVGAPLLASDTQAQLQTKTQTLKNTLATNITSKGVTATGSETLNSLVNKVSNISNGRKYTSGTVLNSGTFSFGYYGNNNSINKDAITVSLDFKPSKISIVQVVNEGNVYWGEYNSSIGGLTDVYTTFLTNGSETGNIQVNRQYKGNTNPAYVTSSGFRLPVENPGTYYYQAWE